MADKDVTLNYVNSTFTPDPATIFVQEGHSILFHLHPSLKHANAKARITFDNPEFFSKPQFHTGDHAIHVKAKLRGPTTYQCELLLDGVPQPNKLAAGGGIEPDTGRASG